MFLSYETLRIITVLLLTAGVIAVRFFLRDRKIVLSPTGNIISIVVLVLVWCAVIIALLANRTIPIEKLEYPYFALQDMEQEQLILPEEAPELYERSPNSFSFSVKNQAYVKNIDWNYRKYYEVQQNLLSEEKPVPGSPSLTRRYNAEMISAYWEVRNEKTAEESAKKWISDKSPINITWETKNVPQENGCIIIYKREKEPGNTGSIRQTLAIIKGSKVMAVSYMGKEDLLDHLEEWKTFVE